MYSIGEMARVTGVKVPTIRYYEQIGLLDVPDRTEGGQRRYEPTALDRLSFIRHCRDLGIGIEAIGDLLRLSNEPDRPCDEVNAIATSHLAAVREKIARLLALESELVRMIVACESGRIDDCKIIAALSDHGMCSSDH